jgi:hypothetical protein
MTMTLQHASRVARLLREREALLEARACIEPRMTSEFGVTVQGGTPVIFPGEAAAAICEQLDVYVARVNEQLARAGVDVGTKEA